MNCPFERNNNVVSPITKSVSYSSCSIVESKRLNIVLTISEKTELIHAVEKE